jgi:polyphosphate kinase 2 (PPK2 family)
LQTELCIFRDWVKQTGQRIIVIFEGRDTAGKGGTIRTFTERVSPRVFRLVALPHRSVKHECDDETPMINRRWIPEKY